MKIEELGEFALIDRIQRALPMPDGQVLVGIGDDVAVFRARREAADGGERVWLATCDVQMEGAHFLRARVKPRELGRKALAINLSDIAATGGTPRYALVSLGLPGDLPVEFVDELYAGLRAEAETWNTTIVGGNISRSRLGLFIDIFLLGDAPTDDVLLRSGAHAGDKILVTGSLGDAAAGLALAQNPALETTDDYARRADERQDTPAARVREGQLIGSTHLASSMIDVSDGLASDLGHICERSRVGARIIAADLPVASENRELARNSRADADGALREWHFALHGGEDYELLFTAAPARAEALAERITHETGTRVSTIGEILPAGAGRELVLPDGRVVPMEARGWDHFRP
jgi:thiamine-monophosphate kinase